MARRRPLPNVDEHPALLRRMQHLQATWHQMSGVFAVDPAETRDGGKCGADVAALEALKGELDVVQVEPPKALPARGTGGPSPTVGGSVTVVGGRAPFENSAPLGGGGYPPPPIDWAKFSSGPSVNRQFALGRELVFTKNFLQRL